MPVSRLHVQLPSVVDFPGSVSGFYRPQGPTLVPMRSGDPGSSAVQVFLCDTQPETLLPLGRVWRILIRLRQSRIDGGAQWSRSRRIPSCLCDHRLLSLSRGCHSHNVALVPRGHGGRGNLSQRGFLSRRHQSRVGNNKHGSIRAAAPGPLVAERRHIGTGDVRPASGGKRADWMKTWACPPGSDACSVTSGPEETRGPLTRRPAPYEGGRRRQMS